MNATSAANQIRAEDNVGRGGYKGGSRKAQPPISRCPLHHNNCSAMGSGRRVGGELTSNPTVRKLTFTGSTEVDKLLIQQCAGTVKKLSLELGGNAPFIVFDDADIEIAVKGAIASKYRNAGQTSVCANRILVQDGVYDAFTKRLAETAGAMKVAGGFEPGAVIGPLIDMKGGREGRGAHRRRAEERRQGRHRRQTRRAGRQLLRADGIDRCDDRHGHHQGGDLRSGRSALPLQERGGRNHA
jgi:acyl-CoA reductase-like NAD-dependent aldehyde dehydrogenase